MSESWTRWEWVRLNFFLALFGLRQRWPTLILNIATIVVLILSLRTKSNLEDRSSVTLTIFAMGFIVVGEILNAMGNLRSAGVLCIAAGLITFPRGILAIASGLWCFLVGRAIHLAVLTFIRCSRCGAKRTEGHRLGPCSVCGHTDNEGLS